MFSMPTDEELHAEYWNNKGKQALSKALQIQPNIHLAKNGILFLGDGELMTQLLLSLLYFKT